MKIRILLIMIAISFVIGCGKSGSGGNNNNDVNKTADANKTIDVNNTIDGIPKIPTKADANKTKKLDSIPEILKDSALPGSNITVNGNSLESLGNKFFGKLDSNQTKSANKDSNASKKHKFKNNTGIITVPVPGSDKDLSTDAILDITEWSSGGQEGVEAKCFDSNCTGVMSITSVVSSNNNYEKVTTTINLPGNIAGKDQNITFIGASDIAVTCLNNLRKPKLVTLKQSHDYQSGNVSVCTSVLVVYYKGVPNGTITDVGIGVSSFSINRDFNFSVGIVTDGNFSINYKDNNQSFFVDRNISSKTEDLQIFPNPADMSKYILLFNANNTEEVEYIDNNGTDAVYMSINPKIPTYVTSMEMNNSNIFLDLNMSLTATSTTAYATGGQNAYDWHMERAFEAFNELNISNDRNESFSLIASSKTPYLDINTTSKVTEASFVTSYELNNSIVKKMMGYDADNSADSNKTTKFSCKVKSGFILEESVTFTPRREFDCSKVFQKFFRKFKTGRGDTRGINRGLNEISNPVKGNGYKKVNFRNGIMEVIEY